MSDKDQKKYTEQELNEILVERLKELKSTRLTYECFRGWDTSGYGINSLIPELRITIKGGDPKALDNLSIRIQELVLEFQKNGR